MTEIKKIKGVIIDDEARARRLLSVMIAEYCPEVEIVAESGQVPDGVLQINKYRPDVVFLDIEMPDYSGFELLDFFREVDFQIIFVTAYSQYAVRAFEVSAVDYLLKPVQIGQLEKAVGKLKNAETQPMQAKLEVLKGNMEANRVSKIAVPVSDGLIFLPVEEVVYIDADGAYSYIYMADGSKQLVSKKLKYFDDMLVGSSDFVRIHRSHLLNLRFVKKYNRHESMVELENDITLQVARSHKVELENRMTSSQS
ncbi:LytTR family DNA-binding domain-containing protein [Reichenbachiella carrageenanivorans]|uniref:LytTR family DNA-binding domain-containing protein n=1 Tax=Reichenbachiella carrageenanivorans TaxID=2979869 RepID=A0ABY6D1A9_9BACT|nr:LytTR family DNA-binding domain-containing protein [Reichenbachiella carrageenanivorans]UXX79946.1 LytTR family DNA-binding domain-containing protein [Reichenbachiella carrageenanivorans]